ncbi:heterokaryon incompatibility protein-domain-containing protein [Dendryphion nanum]|uniref:Heterokaryon incompatibility protein-domain-containing protein n=1 Tax=Dendryphion nanum TaxID=256645 RepID=A0A9P9DD80_9PLEO|nr:heterokaryon incompatibility protein-domain-containing protein [Dendryphion nanum]
MLRMPRFQYRPLQRPGEKRILVVKGADKIEEKLELELWHSPALKDHRPHLRHAVLVEDHVSIKPMPYEAVSYTWAQTDDHLLVRVLYGHRVYLWKIGRSVETMLRYLRFSKGHNRHLWVDALCIRQESSSEKENQVHRMGKIYENAQRVLIWLGTDDQYDDQGVRALHIISNCAPIYDSDKIPHKAQVTAEKFLKRRWFTRLWVIQEVALSRNAIMMCGHQAWNPSNHDHERFDTFVRGLQNIFTDKRMPRETQRLVQRLHRMERFRNERSSSDRSLCQLLFEFHDVQCSDDSDRPYALRSLSRWSVPVDYAKTTEQIYIDFAMREISIRPEVLCFSGAFPSITGRYYLPSWAPDWGHHREGTSDRDKRSNPVFKPLPLLQHFRCQARNDQSRAIPKLVGSRILQIQGVKVDLIKEVQTKSESWLNIFRIEINNWYKMYSKSKKCSQSERTSDSTSEDFIGSLTVGRIRLLPREFISVLSHNYSQHVDLLFINRALGETYQILKQEIFFPILEAVDKRIYGNPYRFNWPNERQLLSQTLARVGLTTEYPSIAETIQILWDNIPITRIRQHRTSESVWEINRSSQNSPQSLEQWMRRQAYDFHAHLDIVLGEIMFRQGIWWRPHAGVDLEMPKSVIRDVMKERTCFITEKGRFGICHPSARPGDIVVSVPNARTPFIMRTWTKDDLAERFRETGWSSSIAQEETEKNTTDKEYLKVICDCYIQEIMKNESPLQIRDYQSLLLL